MRRLTGVLEVGLFVGMAEAAYFGYPDGTVLARWPLSSPSPSLLLHEDEDELTSLSSTCAGRRQKVDASKGLEIAAQGKKV